MRKKVSLVLIVFCCAVLFVATASPIFHRPAEAQTDNAIYSVGVDMTNADGFENSIAPHTPETPREIDSSQIYSLSGMPAGYTLDSVNTISGKINYRYVKESNNLQTPASQSDVIDITQWTSASISAQSELLNITVAYGLFEISDMQGVYYIPSGKDANGNVLGFVLFYIWDGALFQVNIPSLYFNIDLDTHEVISSIDLDIVEFFSI